MLPSHLFSSLPSILSSSLTTTSTPSPHPPLPSSKVYCFNPEPSDHRLAPTTYIACKEALKSIPLGSAGLKPVTFGRKPDAGFQVPHVWQGDTCAVEIDVTEEGVTETTNFASVLMLGFEVAVGCVIPAPHMGGRSALGEEDGLTIWMYGFRPGLEQGKNLTVE